MAISLPRAVPRWGVLLIDLALCLVSLTAAYMLRFNFSVPEIEIELLLPVLPVYIAVRAISFWLGGTYRIMVRYTSTEDARRIFMTVLAGTVTLSVLSALRQYVFDST